ncbi:MAG: ZIP family metal transporter [Halobacteriaceae archaeon]
MASPLDFLVVFLAGLVTALATGLGAAPFFVVDEVGDRWNVALWGLASGIMLSASVFGLLEEGRKYAGYLGGPLDLVVGGLVGVALVVVAHRVISGHEFTPRELAEADVRKLVLVLGVLTVHSFPEGVAIGVAFAELALGTGTGVDVVGYGIPVLAVFMTVAISIHNIPEGVAISIPLATLEQSRWRMVGAAVFSSLPQPIGAVVAFGFVVVARNLLPMGFGFAAGAMIYLVLTEFIPEGLETGEGLPGNGHRELATGLVAGVLVMVPLLFVPT